MKLLQKFVLILSLTLFGPVHSPAPISHLCGWDHFYQALQRRCLLILLICFSMHTALGKVISWRRNDSETVYRRMETQL